MMQFVENENGEDVLLHDVMIDFVKKATNQVSAPILQDDIEYLLIDNDIESLIKKYQIKDIKKGFLSKWLSGAGFRRKQLMKDGERHWYWVRNGQVLTGLNEKMRFYSWIDKFLADKNSILFDDLVLAMKAEKFTYDVWNKHFFYTDELRDGQHKKWKGWIITGKFKERIYKKVDLDDEKTE